MSARHEVMPETAATPASAVGLAPLYPLIYEPIVRRALEEDLGRAGDLTSDAVLPADLAAGARWWRARPAGSPASTRRSRPSACSTRRSGSRSSWPTARTPRPAGRSPRCAAGRGRCSSAERTALNLLGRLCGIATATRDLVAAVAPHGAKVVCTRKTTPGLRALEKYAVRAGGGSNHRFGLDDAVLIKDNHRVLAGGLAAAVERARAAVGHMVKIEVEVDTLAELEEALRLGVDAVLLDNMSLDELRRAVAMCRGRAVTEASGGITPLTAPAIAATGVDLLSVGWLTHSAPALDVALDVAT